MEVQVNTDTIQCPSCQGSKVVHWAGEEYSCLMCDGTGEIELKKQENHASNTDHPSP